LAAFCAAICSCFWAFLRALLEVFSELSAMIVVSVLTSVGQGFLGREEDSLSSLLTQSLTPPV
jgi:hypothetical protein